MSRRMFFSEAEKNILKELVASRIDVIENKKTTFESTLSKTTAWGQITNEFNSFACVNVRSEKQLRKCWDNMKMRAKKNDAVEQREPFDSDLIETVIDSKPILEDEKYACADNSGTSNIIANSGSTTERSITYQANNRKRQYTHNTIPVTQEDELAMRMNMLRQQMEFNREEHAVKMECLWLKKRRLEIQLNDASGADKTVRKPSITSSTSHKSLSSSI